MTKFLVVLMICFGAAAANIIPKDVAGYAEPKITPCYTNAFSGYGQTGFYYTFKAYVEDLRDIDFDNAICSVEQTGMWIYYQYAGYNNIFSGSLYWVHGVGIEVDFPPEYCGITTSLKFAGNLNALNEDSFTLYSGEYFTGNEFYGNLDVTDLTVVSGDTSSVILTGTSPWTFFTGYNFGGVAYCFYPDTDQDVGADGTVLNFGIYGSLTSLSVPDNSFYSAAKGCFSRTVIKAPQLEAKSRSKNGAWGVIRISKEE